MPFYYSKFKSARGVVVGSFTCNSSDRLASHGLGSSPVQDEGLAIEIISTLAPVQQWLIKPSHLPRVFLQQRIAGRRNNYWSLRCISKTKQKIQLTVIHSVTNMQLS